MSAPRISAFTVTRSTQQAPDTPRDATPSERWASALCAQVPVTGDWDPWYPDKDNGCKYTEARKFCAECPLAEMCLAAAMEEEAGLAYWLRFGMRGGRTPAQRAAADPTTAAASKAVQP